MADKACTQRHQAVSWTVVVCAGLCGLAGLSDAAAEDLVHWDFTRGAAGWVANSYVEGLAAGQEGLVFRSKGVDPWIEGPAVDLPADRLIRVTVRMRSSADASGELFYGPTFSAGHSVRFVVRNDGLWHDVELLIAEPLGRGTRFRLDPASSQGQIAVSSIRVAAIARSADVPLGRLVRPADPGQPKASVVSGPVKVRHFGKALGDFRIWVADREMAVGDPAEVIGLSFDGKVEWLPLKDARPSIEDSAETGFTVRIRVTDSRGGHWGIRREVTSGQVPGTVVVETCLEVDADRDVVYLAWLSVTCGLGTFGGHKAQAVLPGLEYLDDEPSSSQADITTPGHVRRMPDPIQVTIPLMALAAQGAYLGLAWEPSVMASPLFDSPDRLTGSEAHLMAVTGPAVGSLRLANTLAAHSPVRVCKGQPLNQRIMILGGPGQTVVPALQHYLRVRGLPELPQWKGGLDSAIDLLSRGWIDSRIREGGRFRHAVWGDDAFGPGIAADAMAYMDWLGASLGPDHKALADRLSATLDLAKGVVPAADPYASAISHVRLPVAPLVFGRVQDYVRSRVEQARALLKGFDTQGIRTYKPGKTDYGSTHFARHANGYSAADVFAILEAAALSGNAPLIREGIELLDRQTAAYRGTVPRGAQTWEVPLHTPDILASAYMTKAYCLGYVLSGRREHLEQAQYWAWTGVPFVYLVDPTPGEVGRYATIPVFGATDWTGSWFGRPVQWCGLVYASALHRLGKQDPAGPWSQIAKGITLTGLQMCWPVTDAARQGLLPDFYHIEAQVSDGPAINPGTLEAHLPEAFGKGALYDLQRLDGRGWLVHAPCPILELSQAADTVTLGVAGWGASVSDQPYHVLISGVNAKPMVVERCRSSGPEQGRFEPAPFDFDASLGVLTIGARGPTRIRIRSMEIETF